MSTWNPRTWSFSHYRIGSAGTGPSSHPVYAFSEDAEGRVWIGTFGGGLSVLDRAAGRFTDHRHDPADPASLASDRVAALLHDGDGVLWVGTTDGLDRLEPGRRGPRPRPSATTGTTPSGPGP